MKKRPTEIKRVDPNTIAQVKRVLDLKERIDDFKEEHRAIFRKLEPLIEEYNAAVEEAEKFCRAEQISCGPFDLYQRQVKYNADKLYTELGEADFLRYGGKLTKKTVYELDPVTFEAFVESGQIPPEVVEEVKVISPRFHKPDKISLP